MVNVSEKQVKVRQEPLKREKEENNALDFDLRDGDSGPDAVNFGE